MKEHENKNEVEYLSKRKHARQSNIDNIKATQKIGQERDQGQRQIKGKKDAAKDILAQKAPITI